MNSLTSLDIDLDTLINNVPTPDIFRSEIAREEFEERDFDRRLELIKVSVLLSIATSLEKMSNDPRGTSGKVSSVLLG